MLAVVVAPSARAADEVPFVVTPDQVTLAMLELAGVGPADHCFQQFSAALHEAAGAAPPRVWDGRIDARTLLPSDSGMALRLEVAADGAALRLVDGASERVFAAAPSGRCPP